MAREGSVCKSAFTVDNPQLSRTFECLNNAFSDVIADDGSHSWLVLFFQNVCPMRFYGVR